MPPGHLSCIVHPILNTIFAGLPMDMYDTHAHVISDNAVQYPPAPLKGALRPGSMDDPMTVERLLREMDEQQVERAVLVQRAHVYGYDNSYVVDCAARYPTRLSAVCLVDALAPKANRAVRHWIAERGGCGIRLTEPHKGADVSWFNSAAADEVWHQSTALGASISLQLYTWNRLECLAAVPDVLARFPRTKVVLEHVTNFVESGSAPDYGVDALLLALRDFTQAGLKLTTINLARMSRNALPVEPVLRRLLSIFGAGRLMWGSDVAQSPQTYAEMTALIRGAALPLNEAERRSLLSETAATFYSLDGSNR
jgi:L-fuconolactonase